MEIIRNLKVPTGNILICRGEHGLLECLSLGDYGAHVNLNQGKKVVHQQLLPLEEKWVITISTQYGCSMGCTFCDVPKVGPGKNATYNDMIDQFALAVKLHPEVKETKRLNVHFARMGEPTWNEEVLSVARTFAEQPQLNIHPVVSTMMPRRGYGLLDFIDEWMFIKNVQFEGNAGLQLSINSTDEEERDKMFRGNALHLASISDIMSRVASPVGRKITLNFAVADYKIDAEYLAKLFSPEHFIVKLTPMHRTLTALDNGIMTLGDYTEAYPYKEHEYNLKKAGFEVLVFIASREEDLGRITCGNAILSGTIPLVPFTEESVG